MFREDPLSPSSYPKGMPRERKKVRPFQNISRMERSSLGKTVTSSAVTLLLVFIIGFTLFSVISPFIGWKVSTVVSGSMEPALHTGSIIIVRPIAPNQVKVGDIILFRTSDVDTIHRVIAIDTKPSLRFTVKGDSNNAKDPSPVLPDQLKGILFMEIPLLGFILSVVKTPIGLVLTIGIPALILVAYEIDKMIVERGIDDIDEYFWGDRR